MTCEPAKQGSAEWLEARRSGIGGSEASILYGCNPWGSELSMWAEKTGRVRQVEHTIHTAPHLYWGTALESAVRQGYADMTGRTVTDGVTMLRHPDVPCLIANTDGEQRDVEGKPGPGVYEGKTASAFSRREWYDEDGQPDIPKHIQVQVQHYLACTGLSWATVAVFFGGDRNPLAFFDIDRHEPLIADLLERAALWWDRHIVHDEQPEVDDNPKTETVLRGMYPRDDGRIIALPDAFAPVLDRIAAAEQIIKNATTEKQRCRNLVISTLGTAAYGLVYDGRGFTHRLEASGKRVLRTASESRMKRAKRDTGTERPAVTFVPPGVGVHLEQISSITWGTSSDGETT